MITLRKLEAAEYSQWDDMVRKQPSGTIYHQTRWLAPVSEAVGDSLAIYGLFSGDTLIGGIPTQVRKRGPFSIARRAFATPYAGLLLASSVNAETKGKLAPALDVFASNFSQTILTYSPFCLDKDCLPQWPSVQRGTYLLRSRVLKGLWRSLASEVRNRIRKAEKSGISIQRDEDAAAFFHLFRDLFLHEGSKIPFSEQSFARLLTQLTATGVARSYLALMPDATPCAACLILNDNRRAYYGLAAAHLELRKTGAASLLVWEALKDCEGQLSEFDFGGANIPAVAQFKRKFRGQFVSYPEFSAYRSTLEKRILKLRDQWQWLLRK